MQQSIRLHFPNHEYDDILFKTDIFSFYRLCFVTREHIDGLAQDCSNSIADAMELLQSCTKPLI